MSWAVVPEPPFLSRPSSSFLSSFFFFFGNRRTIFFLFFFLFLMSNGVEGGYAADCCARGQICVAGT